MRRIILATTALFPLALAPGLAPGADAKTYVVVAPGAAPRAGQFASLNALAQAQEHSPFLQPGDVIQLPAGSLAPGDNLDRGLSDVGTPANPVTITAPPGQYTIVSDGGPALANGKAPFTIYSSAIHVNGVIFLGNYGGSDGDGAGIRMGVGYGSGPNGSNPPYNLTVTNSAFMMNGNGILADDCSNTPGFIGHYGPNTPGGNAETGPCTIKVDRSYFGNNGDGSGLTHNMYIARIDRFTITNSLTENVADGHNIKSRAFNSDIENNRIFDGPFGYSNNAIDFPIGGNEVVKNNIIEKGPFGRWIFIAYNEENYPNSTPPYPNNPGVNVDIEGNTFIDHRSGGGNNALLFEDATWWAGKNGNPPTVTNSPDPQNEVFTFKNNKVFSDAITPAAWCQFCWAKDVWDASNQVLPVAQAPALDHTLPIAWSPKITMERLSVTLNGVENDVNQWVNNPNNPDDAGFPQVVLWWNGQPLAPAPVVVRANQWASPPGEQTVIYQVPVIAGVPNFMAGFFTNPGCCILDSTGKNIGGRSVQWQTARLGAAAPLDITGIGVQAAPPVVFPAQPSDPPVDTTPPVLAPATLTLAAGTVATVVLNATDPDNTAAQLTYKITALPKLGVLHANGTAVAVGSTFTQADVAAGHVTYGSTTTAAATDSFAFTVSDLAGNTVKGMLPITITATGPVMPPTIHLKPGVNLIPQVNGTWGWK